jgi:hypothetical protein
MPPRACAGPVVGHVRDEAQAALELFACLLAPPGVIARALCRGKLMIESPMYDYVRDLTRAQTQLETLTGSVVEALTVRFCQVPPEIAEAVAATADVQRLRELHRLAIRVESIDQFAQALPQPAVR